MRKVEGWETDSEFRSRGTTSSKPESQRTGKLKQEKEYD